MPARITIVPRSGCMITSPHTTSVIGSNGIASCPRSSSLPNLRARTDAENTTIANLAISDGCTFTGPSSNQRDEP